MARITNHGTDKPVRGEMNALITACAERADRALPKDHIGPSFAQVLPLILGNQ